ncbi:unnamed protein product [Linum trigynum]|uniref:Uncharacterized protein n=1 Tax=Linum trigynum TaxID=586398 RepID=A0AAV2FV20_9ROSI
MHPSLSFLICILLRPNPPHKLTTSPPPPKISPHPKFLLTTSPPPHNLTTLTSHDLTSSILSLADTRRLRLSALLTSRALYHLHSLSLPQNTSSLAKHFLFSLHHLTSHFSPPRRRRPPPSTTSTPTPPSSSSSSAVKSSQSSPNLFSDVSSPGRW